jgi:S1-C subfamily serine protease
MQAMRFSEGISQGFCSDVVVVTESLMHDVSRRISFAGEIENNEASSLWKMFDQATSGSFSGMALFDAENHAVAQGANDINAIIRKAPQSRKSYPKYEKAPEADEKPERAQQESRANGGIKSLSHNQISQLEKSATVLILIYDKLGLSSLGSGFFISKSLVLTNGHVTEDSGRVDVVTSDGSHMMGGLFRRAPRKAARISLSWS